MAAGRWTTDDGHRRRRPTGSRRLVSPEFHSAAYSVAYSAGGMGGARPAFMD